MTARELEAMQRHVALHMSVEGVASARTWHEWTDLLERRLAVVQMYTHEEDRPSFLSVVRLVADSMSMLMRLDRAEQADPSTGEDRAA